MTPRPLAAAPPARAETRQLVPLTGLALATALLPLALALALPAAAGAAERTVTVEASATLKVPNDSAGVGISVALERGSRGAALSAVAAKLRRAIAAVEAVPGVGAGDVRTGRVSVDRTRRGAKPRYRASAGASVTLHQPQRAGVLIAKAIAAGATGVSGPTYFVGDSEAAATRALAAAFEKAKARAAALAAAAGATVGQALTIDEGGGVEFTPLPTAKAAPVAACGVGTRTGRGVTASRRVASGSTTTNPDVCASPPPSKPGRSTVSATVRVVFALQ